MNGKEMTEKLKEAFFKKVRGSSDIYMDIHDILMTPGGKDYLVDSIRSSLSGAAEPCEKCRNFKCRCHLLD